MKMALATELNARVRHSQRACHLSARAARSGDQAGAIGLCASVYRGSIP